MERLTEILALPVGLLLGIGALLLVLAGAFIDWIMFIQENGE